MNNKDLAVSFIWKDWSTQSFGYILINIVLNTLERNNRSAEILLSVSANFQYLLLLKCFHALLTVGAIAVSNSPLIWTFSQLCI